MTPSDRHFMGLLVSQIGYDCGHAMRAIVRGPRESLSSRAAFRLLDDHGQLVRRGPVACWGACWGSTWWVADFTGVTTPGVYALHIDDPGRPTFPPELVEIGRNALWSHTVQKVGVEQAERRARLAMNRVGWQDCGAAWQEANSHAAYVLGFCDLLDISPGALAPDHARRIADQIVNGCDYLALLQDRARERGLGDGAVSHQTPKYEELAMPADAAKAAAAWARASRCLPAHHDEKRRDYRLRARRALDWLLSRPPSTPVNFCPAAHGAPAGFVPPPEMMTRDLLMMATAALDLANLDAAPEMAEAIARVNQVVARQVPHDRAEEGLHGHFRLFASASLTEKAWSHHVDANLVGSDAGAQDPHDLLPLIRLCQRLPTHPDAPRWRQAVERFARGYLLPACRTSPFLLLPLGVFPGEGLLHFAGLWHGMNGAYARVAVLALELRRFLDDDAFDDLATANLQWIAGLNAGLTAPSVATAHMFSADVPDGLAQPVSMIHGVGRRFAGSYMNIRGSICNGFSTGEQFRFDVAATRANDGPFTFTDEDWVTHAGDWLSAMARLAPSAPG